MSGSTEGGAPGSHHLDFYQAMADFKLMFPNMDEEIIEAVLRANSGAVDGTIDQLLTMNTDLGVDASSSAAADNDASENALTASSLFVCSSDQVLPFGDVRPKRIVELSNRNRLLTSETSSGSYDDEFQSRSVSDVTSRSYDSRDGSKSSVASSPGGVVFGITTSRRIGSQTLGDGGGGASTVSSVSTFSTNDDLLLLETTTDDSLLVRDSPLSELIDETPFQEACIWDDPAFLPPTPAPAPPIPPRSPLLVAPPLPPKMSLVGNQGRAALSSGSRRHAAGIEARRSTTTARRWDPPMLGKLPDDFLRLDVGGATTSPAKRSLRTSPCASSLSHRGTLSGHDRDRTKLMMSSDDGGAASLLQSVKPSSRVKPLRFNSETTTSSSTQNRNHHHSASTGHRRSHDNVLSATHTCDCHRHLRKSHHSGAALQERLSNSGGGTDHRRLEIDSDTWQMLEDERLALVLQSEEFLAELRQNEDFMKTLENERHLHIFSEDTNCKSSLPGKSIQSEDPAEFRTMLKHIGDTSKKKLSAAAQKFFAKCKKKSQKPVLKDTVAPSTVNLLDNEDVENADDADENPQPTNEEQQSNKWWMQH